MKRIVTGIGALLASAAPVLAGGIERAPQSLAPLFEQGNYAELSFGGVNPDVQGTDAAGFGTGDVAQGYGFFGLAYKHQFTDNLSGAIIVEQPFGADILYPTANSPVLGGTRVEVNSTTYTALLRYKFDNNFSVHGGIRGSHADGRVGLNGAGYLTTAGYNLDIDGAWGVGWVAGVAYEMPEIAARVSLTYNSPIEHDFDMTETGGPLPVAFKDKYTVKTPRSWTLEGQTGIAEDTLLFGSIRWVKWSEFKVDNFLFPITTAAGEIPLVEVEEHPHIAYGKGAVALYMLRDLIGEAALHTALRQYLHRHAAAGPPYPTALDLLAELRAVMPDSMQYLLEDLFETVTLWELKAGQAKAERQADGSYVVSLEVAARKLRADDVGNESEVPMDDFVQVAVFAADGDGSGEPLHLEWHRIRSGVQVIHIAVPRAPGRAAVDPYARLIERQRADNAVDVGG